MIGYLILNSSTLGEITFEVMDETMGVIGGNLIPLKNYYEYQEKIQSICASKGIANTDDFNFIIRVEGLGDLAPIGGIGVTDVSGFDDIYVDVGGLPVDTINFFKTTEKI
jgi:hypothetical protein